MRRVTAVVVNWNSRDDLAGVLVDLNAQSGVEMKIIVVDNNSSDDSLALGHATGVAFEARQAGRNLGYTGGNNLGAELAGPDADVLVVNPDVRLPDASTVSRLADALADDASLGAIAPVIEISPGRLEYLDSEIDLDHAAAVHTHTDSMVPDDVAPRVVSWIDGAMLLVRAQARRDVGFFDDRFFLMWEEVDWCIRAAKNGWRVALCPAARVTHRRSSSFEGTKKGGYYYWRNLYLVCRIHAPSRWRWRWHYLRRFSAFVTRPVILRSGYAFVVAHGTLDGLRGRVGPKPQDAR